MPRLNTDQDHLVKLRTYFKAHKAFPSINRLTEVVGLSSPASVFGLIGRLTEAGYITKTPDKALAPGPKFFERSVLSSSVRAGVPELAVDDDPFEVLTIDDYLISDPNRSVLVRVKGESMRNVGLLDGDICIVERSAPASVGDIVVAIVDDEMTVKTLSKTRSGKFFLKPENDDFQDIVPKGSLEMFGVVVGSFRRYRH